MKSHLTLMIVFIVLIGNLWLVNKVLKEENLARLYNIEALIDQNKQLMDTTERQSLEVRLLTFSKQELKEYNAQVEEKLAKMNVELKNLKAIGSHRLGLTIPVKGKIETLPNQSTSKQDSVLQSREFSGIININEPYLQAKGSITGDSIDLEIRTEVELIQAISTLPKHKFLFWSWGVKGVKQTITTSNPYVHIKYSEFIEIK